MPRYINADNAINFWNEKRGNFRKQYASLMAISRFVELYADRFPADVREERHAKWVFGEFNEVGRPVWCSECGLRIKNVADPRAWLDDPGHKYCGQCGSKMDLD